MIQLADHSATVDRALNMLPELLDKINSFLAKNKKEKAAPKAVEEMPDDMTVVEPE